MPKIEPHGAVAQWLEHLLCKQDVVGSSPISSTFIMKQIYRSDAVSGQEIDRWLIENYRKCLEENSANNTLVLFN